MLPIFITLVLLIGVVLAIRVFVVRQKQQRAAHDARLAAMAQTYLRAAKKKQEAQASAPQTATTPMREERECPFCAEKILKKARVCKHCGRDVEPFA